LDFYFIILAALAYVPAYKIRYNSHQNFMGAIEKHHHAMVGKLTRDRIKRSMYYAKYSTVGFTGWSDNAGFDFYYSRI
jgi:hypothetical protein